jgi:hypothetical protein
MSSATAGAAKVKSSRAAGCNPSKKFWQPVLADEKIIAFFAEKTQVLSSHHQGRGDELIQIQLLSLFLE